MLKKDNSRLRRMSAGSAPAKHGAPGFVRKPLIILLVCLSVALLSAANLLFWVGNTVVKPDRFVAATQPIIKDPVVQNSMALYTTNSIFNNIDVQKVTEEVLPPKADFLAPQLTNQLKSYTQVTLQKALANPSLQDKWNQTIAKQHQRLISFASKYEGDGDISLNDVFNKLTASLSDTKLAFLSDKQLPPKVGDINVIKAAWLPAFHNVVTNIDTWRLMTVVSLVATVTAAVWLSLQHRRTLYIFAVASASMMLATLIALLLVKSEVVGKVDPQYADGVNNVIQIAFHSLVTQTVTIFAAVIFVMTVAWVSGPSRRSNLITDRVETLFGGRIHRQLFAHENRYTTWVGTNKHLLEWLIVAGIAAVMLLVRLTLLGLFWYAIFIAALILIVELIGGYEPEQALE